jgi:DNA-binding transcriptional LysR family regulator
VDRLTSMTVFSRVAATRSFSAAARELGISQATASKHVQTLEHWLGMRLLNRTTRQVGLTDAGLSFYTQCLRILEDMENARQAGQTVASLRGNLRVSVPVGFGSTRLTTILVDFMAENAELSVTITVSDHAVDLIEEGYDLGLRAWSRPLEDSGLVVQPLLPVRYGVFASPAYLVVHGTPEVPADLARMVCLTDLRRPGDVWHFLGPEGQVEVTVNGRLKTDNSMLRRSAALTGAGILLAPDILVEDDVAAGRLVRLLPAYVPPATRLDAVSPAHRANTPKVRQFVSFLTARLRK